MTDRILDGLVTAGLDTWEDLGMAAVLVVCGSLIFGLVTYYSGPLWGLATVSATVVGSLIGAWIGIGLTRSGWR